MRLTSTRDNRVGNGGCVLHLTDHSCPLTSGFYRLTGRWSRFLGLIALLCTLATRIGQAQMLTRLSDTRNLVAAQTLRVPSLHERIADCPSITNTDITAIEICSGQLVSQLAVNTTASNPPNLVEYVRFNTLQGNPYLGKDGIHMVEAYPYNGKAIAVNVTFPPNTTTVDKVYYVYACLKPEPDISVCSPFALITVTVKPQPPKCLPVVIRQTKRSHAGSR